MDNRPVNLRLTWLAAWTAFKIVWDVLLWGFAIIGAGSLVVMLGMRCVIAGLQSQ